MRWPLALLSPARGSVVFWGKPRVEGKGRLHFCFHHFLTLGDQDWRKVTPVRMMAPAAEGRRAWGTGRKKATGHVSMSGLQMLLHSPALHLFSVFIWEHPRGSRFCESWENIGEPDSRGLYSPVVTGCGRSRPFFWKAPLTLLVGISLQAAGCRGAGSGVLRAQPDSPSSPSQAPGRKSPWRVVWVKESQGWGGCLVGAQRIAPVLI